MSILQWRDILTSKSDSFSGFAKQFKRKYFSIFIPVFKMLYLNGDKSEKILIQRPAQYSRVHWIFEFQIEYSN
jgi:hypothetical protein